MNERIKEGEIIRGSKMRVKGREKNMKEKNKRCGKKEGKLRMGNENGKGKREKKLG